MRLINCILLFTLLGARTFSQEFQHLTVENGLSSNVVFSVQQHHKGMMWFSTKAGIDRFDGLNFKHYPLYSANQLFEYGLRHSKLYEDAYGRLWVYNIRDVFLYEKDTDSFKRFYSAQKGNILRDLLVTDSGSIFLGTENGLIRYHIQTREEQEYPALNRTVIKLAAYDSRWLLAVLKNDVLIFDHRQELVRDDVFRPSLQQQLRNKNITAIAVDSLRHIYIGYSGKLSVFRSESAALKTDETLNRLFGDCAIRKILPDRQQRIFVGTDGAGVFQVNADLTLLEAFASDQNDPASIPDNSISDIYMDPDNRLWISGRGLSYHDPNRPRFQTYQHQTNNPNSLTHNSVRTIAEDSNGDLWFGTKYGISIFHRQNQHWTHLTQASSGNRLRTDKILSLKTDPQGGIKAGTYQHGVFQIKDQQHITQLIPGMSVYAMQLDSNELWLGGTGGSSGLVRIDKRTGRTENLPVPYVFSLIRHPQLGILAGGHAGLSIVSPDGRITRYGAAEHEIGSIFCVMTDRKGRIWCASEGQGLLQFNEQTGTFKKYTVANGLPSDLVYAILEDRLGKLWLSTTNGLSCFDPDKEEFRNYSLADGLNIKEFNYGASLLTSGGEMVFGGISGFVLFKPEDIEPTGIRSHLVFTDLKLFSRSIQAAEEHSPLNKVIDETDTLQLRYNQNAISLDFIAINYTHPLKTRYRWKLEGLDKDWSPPGTEHTAIYTNLKPGTYTFRVKSMNDNLLTSEAERSLLIIISPPFWKTNWAYLLYAALGALIIYAIIRFYHIRISELHAKDKIRFFTSLAHDIRTPLSLIRSPLSLAIRRNDFSRDTLQALKTAAHNSDRLSHMINQLLDFEKAGMNKMELQLSRFHAEAVLNELCDNFLPFIKEKALIFTRDFRQRQTMLCADRDKFDKIVYNLLSNAIKYSGQGGQIVIRSDVQANTFLIEVSDTGLGIPKDQHRQIFEHYFRASNAVNSNEVGSGIGLMLTKKLVEIHKGSISFESEAGQGSTFRVALPLTLHGSIPEEADITPPEEEGVPEEDNTNLKKAKLLIAEDHRELLEHLVENLSATFRVYTAGDGKQALAMARSIYPDIILSDVMMPIMNGNQFCYEIKHHIETSHIPVILLTSLSSNQHKIDGMRTGADIYLEKPFDMDLLRASLETLLQNRNRIKEKFLRSENMDDDGLNELDRAFISKAVSVVDANLSNPAFSVDVFEKEIGMSHAALYRKFKTLMGKTPLDFIHEIRLKKAVELLSQGGYQVSEVAYMVGYSDPKYFSTVFKKYFGSNASEYAKSAGFPASAKVFKGAENG